jgi:isocitrate dehydrogenase
VLNLPKYQRRTPSKKELAGVDIFVHWAGSNPDDLAEKMKSIELEHVRLSMITNRGIKVWPDGFSETFCTDHWRCRFKPVEGAMFTKTDIVTLLSNAIHQNIDSIKTENLYAFEGVPAYSLGQGQ